MSSDPVDASRGAYPQSPARILDRIDEGIFAVDTDWEFTFANDCFEGLVGHGADELVGRTLWEVLPAAIGETVRERYQRAMREGETVTFERFCEPFDAWFVVRAFSDDAGLSVHLRDVTDRKERERELELKERAMDAAPVGITITDPDREDNPLIYVNRGFERLTGYDGGETRGRNCRFLQGEDTDPETTARLRRAIDAGETVREEIRNYRADGTPFWNRVTITPVHDEEDALTNYIGTQEDVTERRRLTRELHGSESALRELYEVTSDADLSFEEKVRRILALGRDRLGLSYAFLTRIADGTQRVVEARGSHELLEKGGSCPLSKAYCRRTIRSEGLLGVRDAVSEGWDDDPAYERFSLGCYLGGKVIVDGDLYGTLCFADDDARDAGFTDAERTFVELLVKWMGYELTLQQNERRLRRLQRIAGEMMLAETEEEIARIAVETVRSVLEHPVTGVWYYDDENERLVPVSETDEARSIVGSAPTFEKGESLAWQAFENGEVRTYDDVRSQHDVYNIDTSIRSEIIVPFGKYGVLEIGSTETGTFTEADVNFLRLLAVTAKTALGRTKRERQLRETRERLESRNEMLAALNRIIRHDIRNELTAVLGWGEVLRDRTGPENEEYVDRILAAADHTTHITDVVGEFLEVLEDDAGAESGSPGLDDVLETELERARSAHGDVEFTVEGELPDGLPVEATEHLSSILGNLLRNAVARDESSSQVTVGVETTETSVVLTVASDGSGLPEADDPEVATPERSADGSERSESGVDRYLAELLVDIYGGDLRIEDGPTGDVFRVELPNSPE